MLVWSWICDREVIFIVGTLLTYFPLLERFKGVRVWVKWVFEPFLV